MRRIMTVPQQMIALAMHPLGRRAGWAASAGLVLAIILTPAPVSLRAQPPPPPAERTITLGVNSKMRLQMLDRGLFQERVIEDPTRLDAALPQISDDGKTSWVTIVGKAPGTTEVSLVRKQGQMVVARETLTVRVVFFDFQAVEQAIRAAVPTANIRIVPSGNYSLILTGTVDRAEEVEVVRRTAESIIAEAAAAAQRAGVATTPQVQIINNIRVGGVQQVQLDVVVAQVSRSELRAMAFNFLANSRNFYFGSTVGQAVANPALTGVGGTLNATFAGQALAGVPGSPAGQPTNLLSGVLNNGSGFLQFLQALRVEGVVKNLAEPRLVARSGQHASFLSGGEQAVPVPAGLGQIGVQFEEFGTRLNFRPIVLGNGKIELTVEPEVSDLNAAFGTSIAGTIVPGRTTQRVRTTVELEVGQTFVIGGLIQHVMTASTSKVPVLGDLPFIGTAFSSKSMNETEQEVLVIVTPHLVDGMDCTQYPKVLPGQETRSADDYELFLEGIMEAPRGPREVCHGKQYVPAYLSDPTAGQFPCAGDNGYGHGHKGHKGHAGHGGAGCPTCPGGAVSRTPTPADWKMQATRLPAPTRQLPKAPKGIDIRDVEPMQASSPSSVIPTGMPALEMPAPEKP